MTYSIGMRAPERAELADTLPDGHDDNAFYADPDLGDDEAAPGYISPQAVRRALDLIGDDSLNGEQAAVSLGRCVTTTKQWLTPETASRDDAERTLAYLHAGGRLDLHGMARIAFDATHVYVNGRSRPLAGRCGPIVGQICSTRQLHGRLPGDDEVAGLLLWMLETGAFELNGKT